MIIIKKVKSLLSRFGKEIKKQRKKKRAEII